MEKIWCFCPPCPHFFAKPNREKGRVRLRIVQWLPDLSFFIECTYAACVRACVRATSMLVMCICFQRSRQMRGSMSEVGVHKE